LDIEYQSNAFIVKAASEFDQNSCAFTLMRLYRTTRRYRDKLGPQSRDPSVFTEHIGLNARCGWRTVEHEACAARGSGSRVAHAARLATISEHLGDLRRQSCFAAAGLICHYHRGRRRAATA